MHFQEVFSENTFGHTCPQIILFKKVQGQVAAEMFPFSLHIPSYKSICFAAHRLQSVPNRLVSRSLSSNIQKSNFADFLFSSQITSRPFDFARYYLHKQLL